MLETIQKFLLLIQSFVARNRQPIINIFRALQISIIVIWFVGANLLFTDIRKNGLAVFELGQNLGAAALIFYCITLLPGIITRLQVLPKLTLPVAAIITPFRRQFGITMYLTALTHMSFTMLLQLAARDVLTWKNLTASNAQLAGLSALATLFPLWLTSNDFAVRKLGRKWKLLHRLTYLAMFLIFAHVALFRKNWAVLMAIMSVLLVASWIAFFWRRRQKTSAALTSENTV